MLPIHLTFYLSLLFDCISERWLNVGSRQFIGSDLLMLLVCCYCCFYYCDRIETKEKTTNTLSLSLFMILVHVCKDHCLTLFPFFEFFLFFFSSNRPHQLNLDQRKCTKKEKNKYLSRYN